MASKDRARGKRFELEVGRMFGGRRRRAGEGLDFDDCVQLDGSELPIGIEAKSYEKLQLRSEWVTQAIRNAKTRPWVIVQRPRGSKRTYATCDLQFFLSMYEAWEKYINRHIFLSPEIFEGRDTKPKGKLGDDQGIGDLG